jgi:hypothetical protein
MKATPACVRASGGHHLLCTAYLCVHNVPVPGLGQAGCRTSDLLIISRIIWAFDMNMRLACCCIRKYSLMIEQQLLLVLLCWHWLLPQVLQHVLSGSCACSELHP